MVALSTVTDGVTTAGDGDLIGMTKATVAVNGVTINAGGGADTITFGTGLDAAGTQDLWQRRC